MNAQKTSEKPPKSSSTEPQKSVSGEPPKRASEEHPEPAIEKPRKSVFEEHSKSTSEEHLDCGANASYLKSGSDCEITGDTLDQEYHNPHRKCPKGCFCNEGYARDAENKCISKQDCKPSKCEPCCDKTCTMLSQTFLDIMTWFNSTFNGVFIGDVKTYWDKVLLLFG